VRRAGRGRPPLRRSRPGDGRDQRRRTDGRTEHLRVVEGRCGWLARRGRGTGDAKAATFHVERTQIGVRSRSRRWRTRRPDGPGGRVVAVEGGARSRDRPAAALVPSAPLIGRGRGSSSCDRRAPSRVSPGAVARPRSGELDPNVGAPHAPARLGGACEHPGRWEANRSTAFLDVTRRLLGMPRLGGRSTAMASIPGTGTAARVPDPVSRLGCTTGPNPVVRSAGAAHAGHAYLKGRRHRAQSHPSARGPVQTRRAPTCAARASGAEARTQGAGRRVIVDEGQPGSGLTAPARWVDIEGRAGLSGQRGGTTHLYSGRLMAPRTGEARDSAGGIVRPGGGLAGCSIAHPGPSGWLAHRHRGTACRCSGGIGRARCLRHSHPARRCFP